MNKSNSSKILFSVICSIWLFSPLQAASVQSVDKIVAVVNNAVITQNELAQRVQLVEQQLRARNVALPEAKALQAQVLERLILEQAQLQLAKDVGIQAEDALIDRTVARIAEQNGLGLQDFRNRLEADGISFTLFRQQIREDIIFNRLREREVDTKVQISDGEVENFIAEQTAAANSEVNLAQIFLRLPENASPEQIAKKQVAAEKLMRDLQGGADFASLAAAHSDSPEGLATGGSLGWRKVERLPQLFAEAIANVTPGQLVPILRSPAGFHILKLVDRRAAAGALSGPPVRQTRARHILMRVNELVSETEALRRMQDIHNRLVNGASFVELARLYSGDATAGKGGDLGWLYAGDTVPDFERAMDQLKIDEISQPVRTPFGWHIIQVLERRIEPMGADRQGLIARQLLRERKSDEQYQDWLRQLRDRTFVEYRADEIN